MAKKKKQKAATPKKQFTANPFSDLKGFAASEAEPREADPRKRSEPVEIFGSFEEEMALLGVRSLDHEGAHGEDSSEIIDLELADIVNDEGLTEDEQFLAAMTGLKVDFRDSYGEGEKDEPRATPRRMKQVRRGKLKPQATLDLHGCVRSEVASKLKTFLKNGRALGFETLLVVTGRGLHSEGGEPIVRNEAELYLTKNSDSLVAEWGRAPREYGGEGALLVFLKKNR